MTDMAWVQLKNIVVIICATLGVYYISGWMIFLLLIYTSVDGRID